MNKRILLLVAAVLVSGFVLAGCFGGGGSNDGGPATEISSEPLLQDAAGDPVPEDVPVMPGAYNLDVVRSGTQVNFTIDQEIQAVMDYYSAELADHGWSETRAPDSAIGSIGTMSRENEAGDKIALNMSFNQVSGSTTVAIAISRKQ